MLNCTLVYCLCGQYTMRQLSLPFSLKSSFTNFSSWYFPANMLLMQNDFILLMLDKRLTNINYLSQSHFICNQFHIMRFCFEPARLGSWLFIFCRFTGYPSRAYIPGVKSVCCQTEENPQQNSRTDLWQKTIPRNYQVRVSSLGTRLPCFLSISIVMYVFARLIITPRPSLSDDSVYNV